MTESQKYTVVAQHPGFEVRRYAAHVVAEVTVSGPADEAGNRAFRPLAGYIGGRNVAGRSVAMTAPVLQEKAAGRSIAMTAPVLQQAAGPDASVVGFVMPADESLQTLPAPTDPDVTLRAVPEAFAAAAQYSGRWTMSSYEQHLADLEAAVRAAGLEVVGPARWARYDPPWKPWFLRRNEVLLPVAEP
ncbi:MAG: heme-binding protein [Actinobacteria bacterium]|nr:heme-binding protein [Actinomycetota bacterium]